MSEPTSLWQKVYDRSQEARRAFDQSYEGMLAALHGAEYDRVAFIQKIRDIAAEARNAMEIHKIELLLRDAPYDPEPALDEIFKLCEEQLKETHTPPLQG